MWYWISYDSFCLLTEILEAILSFICDISAAKCNENYGYKALGA